MREFTVKNISIRVFEPESTSILGVVQVAHGMEEHQGRYRDFAEYLVKHGFVTVTADMRGHGEKTPKSDLGWFADRDGWKLLLSDQLTVRDFIETHFPNQPVYLFAHSMGSIISRVLMQTDSKRYDKVVLSGYPNYQALTPLGIGLAGLIQRIKGARHRSKLLEGMAVGVFNRKIKKPETDYDWLSINRENIKAFIDDPLCGFSFTTSAMRDLFVLVKLLHETKRCVNVKHELPILLLSGEYDPCTGGESGRRDSISTLRKSGFDNLSVETFPKMRHEILNETDKAWVYESVLKFLLAK